MSEISQVPAILKFQNFLSEASVNFQNDVVLTPQLLQERRDRILELEEVMKQLPTSYNMQEFNEGKVKHHFGSGVYGRELFIPAGNIIVSKIHRGKTFNIIAKGKISVIDPERGLNTYEALTTFVSSPMTKRIVIAHEDTVWITSHENENNSEDLEEIEDKITAKNFNKELT